LVERTVQQVLGELGDDLSLDTEIGALRLVLQRLVAVESVEADPRATAQLTARLVDSITRAVKAQREMSDDLAGDLSKALTATLIEMGLGEER
jgi:hypothetical protein